MVTFSTLPSLRRWAENASRATEEGETLDLSERRADPRPPSISSYVAAEQRPGQAPCSRIAASSGLELGEERLDLGLILDRTVHHRALQHVDRCGKKSAGGNNGRVGTHEG